MTRHLILSILLLPLASFGQLSGIYTVGGTSPDYATLTDAFNALMTQGANGNVDLLIRPGTYMGQYDLGVVPGSPGAITVRSETNTASDVVLAYDAGGASDNFIVRLDGTEQLHFQAVTFTPMDLCAGRGVPERGAWAEHLGMRVPGKHVAEPVAPAGTPAGGDRAGLPRCRELR